MRRWVASDNSIKEQNARQLDSKQAKRDLLYRYYVYALVLVGLADATVKSQTKCNVLHNASDIMRILTLFVNFGILGRVVVVCKL